MVLLTMTPSIVEGLETLDEPLAPAAEHENTTNNQEPSLESPAVGKPISHGQIIDLWKTLGKKEANKKKYSLEALLRGSYVYIPPPPPKPEPSPEYKALMARLRREEEARAYERMLNPIPTLETFSQRFPNAATAAAFAEVNRPHNTADAAREEASDAAAFKEVNRQLMLVFNFLVSIVGVAATIWMVARWWSTPARVLLTLAGAIVVAVAEVVVYSAFAWRMEQGMGKEVKVREVKEVVNTWVIAGDEKGEGGGVDSDGEKEGEEEVRIIGRNEKDESVEGTNLRRRNKPK